MAEIRSRWELYDPTLFELETFVENELKEKEKRNNFNDKWLCITNVNDIVEPNEMNVSKFYAQMHRMKMWRNWILFSIFFSFCARHEMRKTFVVINLRLNAYEKYFGATEYWRNNHHPNRPLNRFERISNCNRQVVFDVHTYWIGYWRQLNFLSIFLCFSYELIIIVGWRSLNTERIELHIQYRHSIFLLFLLRFRTRFYHKGNELHLPMIETPDEQTRKLSRMFFFS